MVPARCPLCGAPQGDESCQSRFDRALSLEFTDPAFGAVHLLTVTAYQLQHDQYTHAGWLAAREVLRGVIEDGLRPHEVAGRYRTLGDGGSISRGEPFGDFARIRWTRTIADVRTDDAATYRRDVEAWATSVLEDTAEVVR
jgi:hypothetical protein